MPLQSSAYIAEQALRKIGTLSPYDTAALPEEFGIALNWLALLIDEMVATEQLQFFRPANQQIPLEVNKSTGYSLDSLLDTDLAFVTQVFLVLPNGIKEPIEMLRRDVYDLYDYEEGKTGLPDYVYIENKNNPLMTLYPTITENGYSVELSGFKFAEDITVNEGKTEHGFPRGWQLGLIHLLAAELGSGPITTIKLDERRQAIAIGEQKLRRLQARQNKEQVRRPRTTKMRVF